MKAVKLNKSLWGISSAYSRTMVRICKGDFDKGISGIPGLHWSPAHEMWVGPLDAVSTFVEIWTSMNLRGDWSELPPAAQIGVYPLPLAPVADSHLRDYQKTAVNFLIAQGPQGALLGDAMRLGKTCSALTAARALNSRTLIVCPSYVRNVWVEEAAKWWPKVREPIYLPSEMKALDIPAEAQLVVIHYDILAAWKDTLIEWGPRIVCFDEAHALMNESSQRSKAAKAIANRCELRWGLTGTPLANRPKDLWNVVETLSPGRMGTFFQYALRYCGAHKESVTPTKTVWVFDGKSNEKELHSRLRHFMLRRIASDVTSELPQKTRQTIWVDVPRKAVIGNPDNKAELRKYLDASADLKLGAAVDLIKGHLEAGQRVVAFTYRRSVAEYLANNCGSADIIHGGLSHMQRGKTLERVKKSPEGVGHLLAATIDSSSTGIDLSYADVFVFVELTWEPHKLLQAEARGFKLGSPKPQFIQYLIARATSDEFVLDVVINKLDAFEKIVGPTGESLTVDLSETEDEIFAQLVGAIEKQRKSVVKAGKLKKVGKKKVA